MKKINKLASLVLAGIVALGLASCGKKDDKPAKTTPEVTTPSEAPTTPVPTTPLPGTTVVDPTPEETTPEVTTPEVTTPEVTDPVELKGATGIYSYVAADYDTRTQILGVLEKYAYDNFLTGFSLIDDGGYSLYSTTVKRGVDTYVPGYGWATLSDGEIIADLPGAAKAEWKRYYHTFQTDDPQQINYADDKGSVVGDLVGYVSSSYWDTRLNETKDGYEWYSLLAKEKPQAVDQIGETDLATKYEWRIKTGEDGLKYATMSKNSALAAFNGCEVQAEDYIVPYQMYYTQALGWARSAENLDGAGSIKGTQAYYDASEKGFNAEAWEQVGLKVYEREGEWYMSVEFNTPCTPFYAMYYMSSGMFSPVPYEFVTELGELNGGNADNAWEKGCAIFGKTSLDLNLSPVDTYLSLGNYVIEAWTPNEEIVFKRNADYTVSGKNRYKIAGIHFDILEAAKTDNEAAWKEFNAGNLSACGVPSTQPGERTRNDATGYAVYTPGSSNYKLNVNACTPELWEELFGENGTITKTPKDQYWNVEAAMSNSNFLLGLSWALDREKLSAQLGRGPSLNYFGDGYLSDPENGVVYNTTDAHKEAMKDLTANGEYEYGYNLEIAKTYFDEACAYFIENEVYKSGDVITIEIAWQDVGQFSNYGDPIIEMWESAFNAVGQSYGLTLEVSNYAPAVWSDVYYKKMMVGQFDIGFGSISGNTLNPLNFLEVLKSDNSSGFTLNWGADTSVVELEFDGVLWSFDSLWQAAETGGYFQDGVYTAPTAASMKMDGEEFASDCYIENADGTVTLKLNTNQISVDGLVVNVEKVAFDGYNNAQEYVEWSCDFDYNRETGEIVVTVPKEAVDVLFGDDNAYVGIAGVHYVMIDVYYANTYADVPSSSYETIEFYPELLVEEEPAE